MYKKKLCILLIFSKLKEAKLLVDKYRMHNDYKNEKPIGRVKYALI